MIVRGPAGGKNAVKRSYRSIRVRVVTQLKRRYRKSGLVPEPAITLGKGNVEASEMQVDARSNIIRVGVVVGVDKELIPAEIVGRRLRARVPVEGIAETEIRGLVLRQNRNIEIPNVVLGVPVVLVLGDVQ